MLDAGHMVPMDQPKVALDMLSRFLNKQPFSAGVSKVPVSTKTPALSDCGPAQSMLPQVGAPGSGRKPPLLAQASDEVIPIKIMQAIPLDGAVVLRLDLTPIAALMRGAGRGGGGAGSGAVVAWVVVLTEPGHELVVIPLSNITDMLRLAIKFLNNGQQYTFSAAAVVARMGLADDAIRRAVALSMMSSGPGATATAKALSVGASPGCVGVAVSQCCGRGVCVAFGGSGSPRAARCMCAEGFDGLSCERQVLPASAHNSTSPHSSSLEEVRQDSSCPQQFPNTALFASLVNGDGSGLPYTLLHTEDLSAMAAGGAPEPQAQYCSSEASVVSVLGKCSVLLEMVLGPLARSSWLRHDKLSEVKILLQDLLLVDITTALNSDGVQVDGLKGLSEGADPGAGHSGLLGALALRGREPLMTGKALTSVAVSIDAWKGEGAQQVKAHGDGDMGGGGAEGGRKGPNASLLLARVVVSGPPAGVEECAGVLLRQAADASSVLRSGVLASILQPMVHATPLSMRAATGEQRASPAGVAEWSPTWFSYIKETVMDSPILKFDSYITLGKVLLVALDYKWVVVIVLVCACCACALSFGDEKPRRQRGDHRFAVSKRNR